MFLVQGHTHTLSGETGIRVKAAWPEALYSTGRSPGLVLCLLSVLGNGPGLLNDRSLDREAGLSLQGRFSGHSGCGLLKTLAVQLEAGKGLRCPGSCRLA